MNLRQDPKDMNDEELEAAWKIHVRLRPSNSSGGFKNRMEAIRVECVARGIVLEEGA